MDSSPLSAPQFWRENQIFRRLPARAVLAPSIDLNSLPLVSFGLEIILDLERSTEWSPLLNSHHVPPMRINLSSSPGSNSYKEMVVCKQTTAILLSHPQFINSTSFSNPVREKAFLCSTQTLLSKNVRRVIGPKVLGTVWKPYYG